MIRKQSRHLTDILISFLTPVPHANSLIRKSIAALFVVWAAVAPIVFVVCVCAHGSASFVQRGTHTPCQTSDASCHTGNGEQDNNPSEDDSCADISLILDQVRTPDSVSVFFVLHTWFTVDFTVADFVLPPFAAIDPVDTGPPASAPHLLRSPLLQV